MSEQSQHIHFENTNRWSTKQLVTMALICALGALFMYVQLPILPSAPFLTYDPSLVPAMVCGFAYGPGAGTAVAAMAIVIHALTTGDWVGALMNLVATLGYILPAAIVYQKMHTYKGAVIGLVFGVIAATALSMVAYGSGMARSMRSPRSWFLPCCRSTLSRPCSTRCSRLQCTRRSPTSSRLKRTRSKAAHD